MIIVTKFCHAEVTFFQQIIKWSDHHLFVVVTALFLTFIFLCFSIFLQFQNPIGHLEDIQLPSGSVLV